MQIIRNLSLNLINYSSYAQSHNILFRDALFFILNQWTLAVLKSNLLLNLEIFKAFICTSLSLHLLCLCYALTKRAKLHLWENLLRVTQLAAKLACISLVAWLLSQEIALEHDLEADKMHTHSLSVARVGDSRGQRWCLWITHPLASCPCPIPSASRKFCVRVPRGRTTLKISEGVLTWAKVTPTL